MKVQLRYGMVVRAYRRGLATRQEVISAAAEVLAAGMAVKDADVARDARKLIAHRGFGCGWLWGIVAFMAAFAGLWLAALMVGNVPASLDLLTVGNACLVCTLLSMAGMAAADKEHDRKVASLYR